MIHYIIVRRDLPFGTTLAMVAHAAAESNTLMPQHCTVCVLGIQDEAALYKLRRKLQRQKVSHDLIIETDSPWNGQAMAIGVKPGPRRDLEHYFKKMQTYKEPTWTSPLSAESSGKTLTEVMAQSSHTRLITDRTSLLQSDI